MTVSEIKERLQALSEKQLRKLLIKYFEKIELQEVVENHGQGELGKDIVFYEVNSLNSLIWYACVVKAKDVNQSDYNDILRQVNECFSTRYESHTAGYVRIQHVLVITSGVYKSNTKTLISENINDSRSKDVDFWDVGDIARRINEQKLHYLFDSDISIEHGLLKKAVTSRIEFNRNLKLFETDFNFKIESFEEFQIKIRTRAKGLFKDRQEYLDGKKRDPKERDIIPDIKRVIDSKRNLLIHGIATSGKSTILKKLALKCCDERSQYVFFFELNELKEFDFDVEKKVLNYYKKVTKTDLDQSKAKENILVFLDGLDEIRIDDRNKLIIHIASLRTKKFQFFVTSRTDDYLTGNPIIKQVFERFEMLPLNLAEMVELGSKVLDSEGKSNSFSDLVKANEIVRSFPKTPLTTILLAILFKEDQISATEIPKNITELYKKFLDVFLNKWDKSKGISEQFKIAQKEFVLERIAKHMHDKGEKSITGQELNTLLADLFNKHPIDADSPEDFIRMVCDRTNVLQCDDKTKSFKFFHLTIQEYLVSAGLSNKDESVLLENLYDEWWLNANIFYAGRNPDKIGVLDGIIKGKIYPVGMMDKFMFIMHTSKILQAAHLLDRSKRESIVLIIIKVLNELIGDVIDAVVNDEIPTMKDHTLLDIILWIRGFFVEFLSSDQFDESLEKIWDKSQRGEIEFSDILQYCLAYCISKKKKNPDYLLNWVLETNNLNVRWYKIVEVDIDVMKLNAKEKKYLKIKNKSKRNSSYIQEQFKERLKKHYSSITGLKPSSTSQ